MGRVAAKPAGDLQSWVGSSVVCVVAPAGYGKTTLLAQWAQDKGSRVGWVSVDQRDNDPAVLLTSIAVELAVQLPQESQLSASRARPPTAGGVTARSHWGR